MSRSHAKLIFENQKFTIKDGLSKFGTLVQIQDHIILKPNQTRIIQVGRTLMNVSIQPVKRHQPAHSNAIMWEESKKHRPKPVPANQHHIYNQHDNKV